MNDTLAGNSGNHESPKRGKPEKHRERCGLVRGPLLSLSGFRFFRVFVVHLLLKTTPNPILLLQSGMNTEYGKRNDCGWLAVLTSVFFIPYSVFRIPYSVFIPAPAVRPASPLRRGVRPAVSSAAAGGGVRGSHGSRSTPPSRN